MLIDHTGLHVSYDTRMRVVCTALDWGVAGVAVGLRESPSPCTVPHTADKIELSE